MFLIKYTDIVASAHISVQERLRVDLQLLTSVSSIRQVLNRVRGVILQVVLRPQRESAQQQESPPQLLLSLVISQT